MGILSRAVLAAGAFYALNKYRKFNADVEEKVEKNKNAKAFHQEGATSENTMPDVEVTVERSSAHH